MHKFLSKLKITLTVAALLFTARLYPQQSTAPNWIRPDNAYSTPVWGIHNGIVVGLWPASLEKTGQNAEGGPRGLLRIGYEKNGTVYLINFIAVEPLIDTNMEFSEVSPSRLDGEWGKFFWASDKADAGGFSPYAATRGVITHPDKEHPEIEELSLYVQMEQFLDGARPFLRLTIRSDKPGELGLQLFNHDKSTKMDRCALTATMGNYSRLRLLYLKDKVVDSKKLFAGYDDIGFDEKEPYSAAEMLRGKDDSYLVCAESDETFNELASWPQDATYMNKSGWRYRPFYKLTQYWRVDATGYDRSLQVRVNGRSKYWGGDSPDRSKYANLPGGPAFENFELRETYKPGQKFYFGLSLLPAKEFIAGEVKLH